MKRAAVDRIRKFRSFPFQSYEAAVNRYDTLLEYNVWVKIVLSMVLTGLGGNFLVSGNPIKKILFELGAMEWETSLMRNFAFNNALAVGIGTNLLMYVPSIYITEFVGPAWTSFSGFFILFFSWYRIWTYSEYSATFVSVAAAAIGSSLVFHSLQTTANMVAKERVDILILAWFTFAESFSVVIPILVQYWVEFAKSQEYSFSSSWVWCFSVSAVVSSLFLPSSLPIRSERDLSYDDIQEDSLIRFLSTAPHPGWKSFLWDREIRTRMFVPPHSDPFRGDPINASDEEHSRKLIIPGDIPGTLLHSTTIDPRLFAQDGTKRPPDDPVFWKLNRFQMAVQPQFVFICIGLGWLQFLCVDRFLSNYEMIKRCARTTYVANHYQYIFDWLHPLSQLVFVWITNVELSWLSLNWIQLMGVFSLMFTLALLSLLFSMVPYIFVQLISFSCILLLYPLVKSFGIAIIAYMFGPRHFYFLFSLSLASRAAGCFIWTVWQDIFTVHLQSDLNHRLQICTCVSAALLCASILLGFGFEPDTVDIFDSFGLDETNPNLPPHIHPNMPTLPTSNLSEPESRPNFTPGPPAAVQPRIRATIFGIATVSDDLIIHRVFYSTLSSSSDICVEPLDVFGREYHPQ